MMSPSANVVEAARTKLSASSAMMPPRKPTAARANIAPEAIPNAADCQESVAATLRCGQDIMTTPTVAMRMAVTRPSESWSQRNASPQTATCTGSVLDRVIVTTNDRSRMAASSKAVPQICAIADDAVQATMAALSCGSG